ncbi:hypothetical protein KNP414_00239 [Paenibacillus mucilaginosus KNP414]|uniref:Uncharacterized protein n=1 Tax=Paenibacillus mucilaginosus (strain KNP414) TaxID=1036673 RepID=F8FM72_PAEMK|nr:hypothetical protein KNP414_00239 [Paenibacillus mucilaginosus KNP414]
MHKKDPNFHSVLRRVIYSIDVVKQVSYNDQKFYMAYR